MTTISLAFQLCMIALWSSLRVAYSLNAPNVPPGTLAPRSASTIHRMRFGSHLLLAPLMHCPQSARVSVDTFNRKGTFCNEFVRWI